jgi:hypothetical protein
MSCTFCSILNNFSHWKPKTVLWKHLWLGMAKWQDSRPILRILDFAPFYLSSGIKFVSVWCLNLEIWKQVWRSIMIMCLTFGVQPSFIHAWSHSCYCLHTNVTLGNVKQLHGVHDCVWFFTGVTLHTKRYKDPKSSFKWMRCFGNTKWAK